jgi:NitT/TauT family transport system substrate-binding protein
MRIIHRTRPRCRAQFRAEHPAWTAIAWRGKRDPADASPGARLDRHICAIASKKPQARSRARDARLLEGAHAIGSYSRRRCDVRGPAAGEKTTMTRAKFITALCALALITGAAGKASSQETLKVAIPQRGAWDAGIAELGQRGGIFKKHGLNLEILYVQAGPESIQALIAGSMDIATAAGVSAAVGTFAKGAPIRIIGSEMIGAPDLYWYVPANSPIHKIEDLNGKTVAYSLTGSSSHAALLALIAQYHLTAKPTSTGNIASTITQTMSGQVDVGFGAAPFGLDLVEDGKVRIIATGSDVTSLRTRTVRVNLTNVSTLQNRHDAIVRFNRAYQDTVAWMYSDPAALKLYAEYSNLPEKIVLRVRQLIPRENLATGRIEGIDQIMADAVAGKFIPAPLTAEQVKELVQIPK